MTKSAFVTYHNVTLIRPTLGQRLVLAGLAAVTGLSYPFKNCTHSQAGVSPHSGIVIIPIPDSSLAGVSPIQGLYSFSDLTVHWLVYQPIQRLYSFPDQAALLLCITSGT